jgi:uncharacterized membrane protein YfcA
MLVGMTGMGGGSLMTPILVLVFGFKPTYAVGTDIFHGAIFKSFGAVQHRRLGTVHTRLAAWMLLGSAPFSLLGVASAGALARRYGAAPQTFEQYATGVALVAGGLGFLLKSLLRRSPRPSAQAWRLSRREKAIALAMGCVFGFIVGLTSVGSGTFFGLVMVLAFPLSMPQIVGTDIFHAAALLCVAGIGHLVSGNVDLHATAWLLLGSIPGVLLSGRFTLKLPDLGLRIALGVVLLLSGLKLLNVPQTAWVVTGTLVVLACVVAVAVAADTLVARARQSAARAG